MIHRKEVEEARGASQEKKCVANAAPAPAPGVFSGGAEAAGKLNSTKN
jgi:hypothetical protein